MITFNVYVVLSDSTLKVKKDGHSNFESFAAAYEVGLDQVKVFVEANGTGSVYVTDENGEPFWGWYVCKGDTLKDVRWVDYGKIVWE